MRQPSRQFSRARNLLAAGANFTLLIVYSACQIPGAGSDKVANVNQNAGTAATAATAAPPPATVDANAAPPAAVAVSRELDAQTNHPNGAVLRLTNITFNSDSIAVSLAVTNGHKDDIRLNDQAMLLRDNLGNRYNLAAPPQNPQVRVPAGNTLDGKFVFLGRLNPSATSLTLVTNDRFGGDSEHTNVPKITVPNIPVK